MTTTVIPSPADAGGTARVVVTGEVDVSNAERLRQAILAAAAGHGAHVDGDLASVTFMDSSGLKAITDASLALETSGAGLVLCNASCQVRRILEITDTGRTVKVRQ